MPEPTTAPTAPKTVTLTIEGRAVQVPVGTSILEAAKQAGVLIPHYCYHPALPVAGLCRMCLVEVEKSPKLAPACATAVADGQVVHVHGEAAKSARQGVLEMLLINHPLDCPICDQSGECELQDYTYAEGRKDSRYREAKRFNPVEDFGGDVLYVPNRMHPVYALCAVHGRRRAQSRAQCQRARRPRGHRQVRRSGPHTPVGRQRDRAVPGWCPAVQGLSQQVAFLGSRPLGIGMPELLARLQLDPRDARQRRGAHASRVNQEVNQFFLCDEGRLNYRWLSRRDRVEFPHVRQGSALAPWTGTLRSRPPCAAMRGRRVFVLASPGLSNEALFLLAKIAERAGGAGAFRVPQGRKPRSRAHQIWHCAPTERRMAGVRSSWASPGRPLRSTGCAQETSCSIADEELSEFEPDQIALPLAQASAIVAISTALPDWARKADVVLPIANMAEEEGTFTNLRGRVQRYLQAKAAPALVRPGWSVLSDLLTALGDPAIYFLPAECVCGSGRRSPGVCRIDLRSPGSPRPAGRRRVRG